MRVVEGLNQGTDEWLRWRNTGIGSSDAPIILGVSPWTTPRELFAEKTTGVAARKQNYAMKRGHDLEPGIRSWYESMMGFRVPPLCAEHDEHEWLKVSLDGWHEEYKLAVEIKAPNKIDHASALSGHLPEKYKCQCDHHLLVSGGRKLDYVSYNPNFPKHEQYAVVSHQRDEDAIEKLFEAEKRFWEKVRRGVWEE